MRSMNLKTGRIPETLGIRIFIISGSPNFFNALFRITLEKMNKAVRKGISKKKKKYSGCANLNISIPLPLLRNTSEEGDPEENTGDQQEDACQCKGQEFFCPAAEFFNIDL